MPAPDLGDNPDNNCECFFVATEVIMPGSNLLWHYGLFHGIHKINCDDDYADDRESENTEVDHDAMLKAQQLTMAKLWKRGIHNRERVFQEEEKERIRVDAAERYQRGELQFVATESPDFVQGHQNDNLSNVAVADQSLLTTENHQLDDGIQDDCILPDYSDNISELSSEADAIFRNESQIQAEQDRKVSFELSSMSAQEIWDRLFSNKKLKGGYIARSLFISGRMIDSKICEPWIGNKTLCTKKAELSDQRKLFLQWAGEIRVLRWVRKEIFTTVVARPQTYKLLDVKHAEYQAQSMQCEGSSKKVTLAAIEATDDTMARIAHLACTSESRNLLHMIYGTKTREYIDQPDLQAPALWQDLANQFINNPDWTFNRVHVSQTNIDATKFPNPGISGDCVRDCFTAIKASFGTLSNAVFARTGCNSTGEEMYGQVWKNYINGKYLYFPRPEVAMYTFKLWNETDSLPKYCIKELHPEAAVRVGVGSNSSYTLPVTPRSSSASGLMSPTNSTSGTASTNSIDKLAQYLELESSIKRQRYESELQQPKVL